jgi:hypothetical protein
MAAGTEHASKWAVTVYLEDHDEQTRARARLETGQTAAGSVLEGVGHARRNPRDRDVPEIGRELATARALSDLAHKLFEATVDDIAAITHSRVVISS